MKSSTEAELVGASDYLGNTILLQHFMAAQGYPITYRHSSQDNENAIKMEKNSQSLAGQQSQHINICHFSIMDQLKANDLSLKHCDTVNMLTDFLTKPMQGSLFHKLHDVLLSVQPLTSLVSLSPPLARIAPLECVEKKATFTTHIILDSND